MKFERLLFPDLYSFLFSYGSYLATVTSSHGKLHSMQPTKLTQFARDCLSWQIQSVVLLDRFQLLFYSFIVMPSVNVLNCLSSILLDGKTCSNFGHKMAEVDYSFLLILESHYIFMYCQSTLILSHSIICSYDEVSQECDYSIVIHQS